MNQRLDFYKVLPFLQKSKFRMDFDLGEDDLIYINRIGEAKLREHALDFITKRLAAAKPKNDGKQTPFKGHPVFKAQHATATCCRGCLSKWYKIPKGKELTEEEIEAIADILVDWINWKLDKVKV
jgi:exodeoxyribonuclease V alpha subunit